MNQQPAPPKKVYIFLDEGGNLDFSPSGSKFFTMTSVLMSRPFALDARLTELRFDVIESGEHIEGFHATEDRQDTRDKVFAVIQSSLHLVRADSIIVEKRKTGPSFRADHCFYPNILGYLIRYVVKAVDLGKVSEVIVITDRIPVNKKRKAVEKAVKVVLAGMLPSGMKYRVLHHDSRSCCGLQVADYFNWAIYRAWDRGDSRSLDLVRPAVKSQFDIFARGTKIWY